MMKRVVCLFLAMVTVLSLGATAFAYTEMLGRLDFDDPSLDKQVQDIMDEGEYDQKSARNMLTMINNLRTMPNSWVNGEGGGKRYIKDLKPYDYDYGLEIIAMRRAAELAISFSHTRPDGSDITTCKIPGVSSISTGGENICMTWGHASAKTMFTMFAEENQAYQGHRYTMLSSTHVCVGVACFYYKGKSYCVQEFGYTLSRVQDHHVQTKYPDVLVTPAPLPVPKAKITGLTNVSDGVVKVEWDEIQLEDKTFPNYRVYWKTDSMDWQYAGTGGSSSMVVRELPTGTKCSFTVQVVSEDWSQVLADYDPVGESIVTSGAAAAPNEAGTLEAPWITSCGTSSMGMIVESIGGEVYEIQQYLIRWSPVEAAARYHLLYRTADSDWTVLCDTSGCFCITKDLPAGQECTFAVRCVSADGSRYLSEIDEIKTRKCTIDAPTPLPDPSKLTTPKVREVYNVGTGKVRVVWEAVKGADNYQLYYKTAGKNWKKAVDTPYNSYVVNGLSKGTRYWFTVKCMSADGTRVSDYDRLGFDVTTLNGVALAAPKLDDATGRVSVSDADPCVSISWKAVPGAAKYRVFYREAGGSWKKLDDTTYTFYNVELSQGLSLWTQYFFTVRCLSADGKTYTSDYDRAGVSAAFIPHDDPKWEGSPDLTEVTNVGDGTVQLAWYKLYSVAKYRVLWKADNGWMVAGDTQDTSFTVSGLPQGTRCTFAVLSVSADGKLMLSEFPDDPPSIITTGTPSKPADEPIVPQLTKVANVSDGAVQVTWKPLLGAEKYRVFWKTTGGKWKGAGDTTKTSFTVKNLPKGTKCIFTVRCVSADGKSFTSGYDKKGLSITTQSKAMLSTPKLTKVKNVSAGVVQVTWKPVSGAAKYRVFWKTTGGKWKSAGDTAKTSFTAKDLPKGTKCIFTVRCVSANGKSFTSSYDTKGLSVVTKGKAMLSTPKLTKAANVSPGAVQVTWKPVSGAEKYRVFWKTPGGKWKSAGDTTKTSFIARNLPKGTKCIFTVRCVSANGKSFTSGYNTKGLTVTTQK